MALHLAAKKLEYRDRQKPEQGEVVKALVESNYVFAALPMRQEPLLRRTSGTTMCRLALLLNLSLRRWSRMFTPQTLQSLARLAHVNNRVNY